MLNLNFHDHTILVRCKESSLLEKLRDEFHYFVVEETRPPEFTLDLLFSPQPVLPSLVAVKILENAAVYRMGHQQYVDYFGEALTIWNDQEKKVQVYTTDPDRMFELAFLAIHSFLGQELDHDGLSRIHALAVAIQNVNAVIMLPSKGGKSTLLKNLLSDPDVRIISDDMPLCNWKGELYPFPSKISLGEIPQDGILAGLKWHEFKRHHFPPKWTASLAQLKDRLCFDVRGNRTLLMAGYRLSTGKSMMTKVSKWKMIAPLMEHMVIGFGLPQILELFLKFSFSDIFKLAGHALMRSVCAFNLVLKSDCYYFYMGPDKESNARLILDLLHEHKIT